MQLISGWMNQQKKVAAVSTGKSGMAPQTVSSGHLLILESSRTDFVLVKLIVKPIRKQTVAGQNPYWSDL